MSAAHSKSKTAAQAASPESSGTRVEIFKPGIARITLPLQISDQCLEVITNIRAALEKSSLDLKGIEVSCTGHERLSVSLLASLLSVGRSYGGSTVALCDLSPNLIKDLTRDKYHRLFELRTDSGSASKNAPDRDRTTTLHNELRSVAASRQNETKQQQLQPPARASRHAPSSELLKRSEQNGVVTFSFACKDLAAEPGLLTQFKQDLASALQQSSVVIDLSGVQRVGVAFVGVLLSSRRAKTAGGAPVKLQILQPNSDIYDFLKFHHVPGLPSRKAA